MKTRILTAVAAIVVILVPCIIFMHTVVLPVILGLFAAIAVHEVIKATGGKNNVLLALSCITAAAVPFLFHFNIEIPFMPVAICYALVYFIIMVPMHKVTTFNDVITGIYILTAVRRKVSQTTNFVIINLFC